MFPPGATLGAIVIPIIDDEVAEPPEFFRVDLSPGEDVTLTTSLATVNINDNDGQYNHLNLYIMYYRVSECRLLYYASVSNKVVPV